MEKKNGSPWLVSQLILILSTIAVNKDNKSHMFGLKSQMQFPINAIDDIINCLQQLLATVRYCRMYR